MAIFRSLQKIIKNPNLKIISKIKSQQPFSRNPFLSPLHSQSRFLSPLSSDVIISPSFSLFNGPLFLSSSPWMLSQSATPLLVRSDVILPRSLKILQNAKLGFPINLGFVKPSSDARIEKIDAKVDVNGGGLVDSIVNLPNFVSFARLLSGPLLGWMIVNEWYLPAFAGLAISGASDWLDGFLARKMGINSVVGSYLDPLADKVLVGCVAVAMVEKGLLHSGLVSIVVLRDVILVGGAFYKRGSSLSWKWKSWYDFFNIDGTHPEKIEPLFISKVNTFFQIILVAGALLQPELGTPETQTYVTYLSWLVASTTVGSTAAYGVQHMRNRSLSTVRSR
ncbi:cardiolipin synthase (CMP-forming), mitochondrial-like [Chenopodium quinoa]|uniref:cardiolipin synthase (CMP-forming), mitochondrial-like n=1 Tax=Chenopodium quinoa TaxID=63459 RepID=UPI000B76EC03|nr:cardiolipin synthase (CMP-forming), mitochondrial-like [Chenopodium quinoa]